MPLYQFLLCFLLLNQLFKLIFIIIIKMSNSNSNSNYILCEFNYENVKITENLCLDKNNFDLLKCPICNCIPVFPKSCSKCECLICNRCLSNHSTISNLCPNKSCNQAFTEKCIPRLVSSLLNNTLIKCPNFPNCIEEKKIVELLEHLQACKHTVRIAKCNGCSKNVSTTNELKEIISHVMDCQSISEGCRYCTEPQMRKDMQEHLKNCPEFPIKCQECFLSYKRKDSHLIQDCLKRLKTLYQTKKNEGKN
jgi:hypothetical protein